MRSERNDFRVSSVPRFVGKRTRFDIYFHISTFDVESIKKNYKHFGIHSLSAMSTLMSREIKSFSLSLFMN